MDAHHFAAQLFQQAWHDIAACAIHGVDCYFEFALADSLYVDKGNFQGSLDMDAVGIGGDFVAAHGSVVRIIEPVLVCQFEQFFYVVWSEK